MALTRMLTVLTPTLLQNGGSENNSSCDVITETCQWVRLQHSHFAKLTECAAASWSPTLHCLQHLPPGHSPPRLAPLSPGSPYTLITLGMTEIPDRQTGRQAGIQPSRGWFQCYSWAGRWRLQLTGSWDDPRGGNVSPSHPHPSAASPQPVVSTFQPSGFIYFKLLPGAKANDAFPDSRLNQGVEPKRPLSITQDANVFLRPERKD